MALFLQLAPLILLTQFLGSIIGGNLRKRGGGNVFGIKLGVGITLLVRQRNNVPGPYAPAKIFYHMLDDKQSGRAKLALVSANKSIAGVEWQELQPDSNYTWLTEGLQAEFDDFLPMGTKEAKSERVQGVEAIFKNYGRGVATSRDDWAYDYDREVLASKIQRFIDAYNAELDRWNRRANKTVTVDNFVTYDDTKIKWSRDLKLDLQRGHEAVFADTKVRQATYRPFCKRWLFFDRILNEEVYQLPQFFPTPASEVGNAVICVAGVGDRTGFGCLITNMISSLDLAFEKTQCFPYYTYSEDGSNQQENITEWALAQFRARYWPEVSKRDIFYYVYALLHHPQYRERYAENLKRELPRIPLLPDHESFQACVQIGAQLAEIHLNYEQVKPYPLQHIERDPFSWRVEKMRLTPDKSSIIYNDSLTLKGIPSECFQYRLGNRSALEWVIDQYQVSTDSRSGIKTDPNRADDEEYIVRLVKQVITVSLETVKLVSSLPPLPELVLVEAMQQAEGD